MDDALFISFLVPLFSKGFMDGEVSGTYLFVHRPNSFEWFGTHVGLKFSDWCKIATIILCLP